MASAMVLRQAFELGLIVWYGGGGWLRVVMDHSVRRIILYNMYEIL